MRLVGAARLFLEQMLLEENPERDSWDVRLRGCTPTRGPSAPGPVAAPGPVGFGDKMRWCLKLRPLGRPLSPHRVLFLGRVL